MINYNDKYYQELSDLIKDLDIDNLKPGDIIECEDCTLEPIFLLTSENLMSNLENLYEDRTSEDGDEYDSIKDIFEKNINFEVINSLLPKLWYPNGKEIVFTYEQIMQEINQ